MAKKRKSTGALTLAEHDALLKAEGRYEQMLENQRQRHEEVKVFQAELRKAEEPVMEDLRKVGIEVNRLWDLLSFDRPYPEAFPILLEHLQKPHRGEVHERLGRALAVPEARPLWPTIVQLYKIATTEDAKTGLADAISTLALKDRTLLDEVIALFKDRRNGSSRLFFVKNLIRSREPRARATLIELKDDPDLYKEIAFRLKRSEQNAKRRTKRRGQDKLH